MRFLNWIMALLFTAALAACGGGGGSSGTSVFGGGSGTGTGTGTTTAGTLSVTISSTNVTATAPATVTMTLTDASGNPIAGSVITIASKLGLGVLSAGTVLTDTKGVATATVKANPAGTGGADTFTATATVGTTAVTGSVSFTVAGSASTAGGPTLLLSISSTQVTASAPATVTATLLDANGKPLTGQLIKFSTVGGLGTFDVGSALTDASGKAIAHLSPASSSVNGADLAQATATITGSGSSPSTPTNTIGFEVSGGAATSSGTPSISIALSTTTVTTATPATVTVSVKNAAGVGISGQVVSFTASGGLGTFSPASALTGGTGSATVTLAPAAATTNGADLAIAQVTVNGTLVTASVGFSVVSSTVAPVGTPSIALALSTSTVTTSTPATVSATVKDATGIGIAGQVVQFKTVDGLGTLNPASALTNASGAASVQLVPVNPTTSGADQVVATTTVGTTSLQASQGFQLRANNVTISSFTADKPTLNAYDQTGLTVVVAGSVSGTPVTVSISSACVSSGKASLTPATATTTTGTASFTYRDIGCGATAASDSLQATVVGTSATSSLSLKLTAPTAASITFSSATPTTIYLKGTGLTETATVVFKVVDTAGNGLPNQNVVLTPSTLAGGLTINGGPGPVTLPSDSSGNVSVLINSGTVPTPVRVNATLQGTSISTVSSSLSIGVGLPSEANFSLSELKYNIEGFQIDGTPDSYTIFASDRLGNPVPAGTAITFVSETGGQVEPNKLTSITTAGLAAATANFVSAGTRPADGRVTVLAYALGEETFQDLNGTNVWAANDPFQDLGTVYLDTLYNGRYDPAQDQTFPLALSGTSSTTACAPLPAQFPLGVSIPSVGGSTCDGTWGPAYVRRALEVVLSTSGARPVWLSSPGDLYVASPDTCSAHSTGPIVTGYDSSGNPTTASFYIVGGGLEVYNLRQSGGTGSLSFYASDANPVRFNPMAVGTTVAASTTTTGLAVTLLGGSPVPNILTASSAAVSYTFTAPTADGTVTLSFTSPVSGTQTNVIVGIHEGPAPAGLIPCQ
jgi:hypothetical protein